MKLRYKHIPPKTAVFGYLELHQGAKCIHRQHYIRGNAASAVAAAQALKAWAAQRNATIENPE